MSVTLLDDGANLRIFALNSLIRESFLMFFVVFAAKIVEKMELAMTGIRHFAGCRLVIKHYFAYSDVRYFAKNVLARFGGKKATPPRDKFPESGYTMQVI
jgi:hypothetical protein